MIPCLRSQISDDNDDNEDEEEAQMSCTTRDGAAIDLTAVLPLDDILPMYGTASHVWPRFLVDG